MVRADCLFASVFRLEPRLTVCMSNKDKIFPTPLSPLDRLHIKPLTAMHYPGH